MLGATDPLLSSSSATPSIVVVATSAFSLVASTLLASYWPMGEVSGQLVQGLAMGSYTRWPLWIWIYSIGCWVIQVIVFLLLVDYLLMFHF